MFPSAGHFVADFPPIQFVVSATSPSGVFWLSRPSSLGLRTLVACEKAEDFSSFEAAERAIKKMPKGYKLAQVHFGIELSGDLRRARTGQSTHSDPPPEQPEADA
jgi:hypothetical protein